MQRGTVTRDGREYRRMLAYGTDATGGERLFAEEDHLVLAVAEWHLPSTL